MAVDPTMVASVKEELEKLRSSATPAAIQDAAKAAAEAAGSPSEQEALFSAAVLRLFSPDRAVSAAGLEGLRGLLLKGYRPPTTLFFLAVGHMNRGDFPAARAVIHQLVRMEPGNERAAALIEVFKAAVRREALPGMLLTGAVGVAAVGGLLFLGAWLLRGRVPALPSPLGGRGSRGALSGGGSGAGRAAGGSRPAGVGGDLGSIRGGGGAYSSGGDVLGAVPGAKELLGRLTGR